MKENPLKTKHVGGGGGENTEIALEIHMQETEEVLIALFGVCKHLCHEGIVMLISLLNF